MAEYTITDPKGIRIKSLLLSDIQGMHTLLKKEGCIDSENISPTELKSKLSSSKSLVLSDDYSYTNVFYVLFKQSVLTPTQYNRLKRQFAGKPQFRFVNAIKFYELFD